MKVLILHQHFNTPYTGGAIRSYYLARALADRGIGIRVITAWNRDHYKTEIIDGIEVHYLPVAYDNSFGFYRRSRSFMQYVWGVVRMSKKFRDTDICYAMSVPLTVGIAAMYLQRRFKISYVFEVGDLWPDAPIQMGFIRNKLFQKMLFRLERSVYRSAQSVVALSTAIRSSIEKKIPGKQIHLIPNMADTDFFKPETKNSLLQEKFGVEGKFVVSYLGAIGVANGLEHVLTFARASQGARLPVHFLICGEGALLPEIKKKTREFKLGNVTILPFQERAGVKEILNVTDAAFISYKPFPILETGSPNKYFDGLAAGKLIIVNFNGWIRDEIEKVKCGIYVNPYAPESFVSGIRPFLKLDQLLSEYQKASRELAEKKYSRTDLSATFSDVILRSKT